MTYFIFAGDMLVMLFMIGLVIWLGVRAPKEEIRHIAEIPLHDEHFDQNNH